MSTHRDPVRKGSINRAEFGVTEATNFPEHLKLENQSPSEENIALFKASMVGSITGVKNALSKGGKPNFFYRPEDQKNSLHIGKSMFTNRFNPPLQIMRVLQQHQRMATRKS
jgi:hypothetical protein